jgi:hypothetical protein
MNQYHPTGGVGCRWFIFQKKLISKSAKPLPLPAFSSSLTGHKAKKRKRTFLMGGGVYEVHFAISLYINVVVHRCAVLNRDIRGVAGKGDGKGMVGRAW